MTNSEAVRRDGSLTAQITRAVVGVFRDYTGRGPTKACTLLNEDLIQVLLEDTMTTAERQLANGGEEEFVLDIRRKFQRTMRDDLVAAVEGLSGRRVIAFMSDNTTTPDMALESFVLDPHPNDSPSSSAPAVPQGRIFEQFAPKRPGRYSLGQNGPRRSARWGKPRAYPSRGRTLHLYRGTGSIGPSTAMGGLPE